MKKLLFLLTLPLFSCSSDNGTTDLPPNPVEVPSGITPENVRSLMADPNATDETVALFYNLKMLSATKFAVGQQDAFNGFYNNNTGDSDIKKTTGNDPALLGSDFMFITDDNNNNQPDNWFYQQEQKIIQDTKNAYNKGMINTFCWHLREPFEGQTFYTSEMTEAQKLNAFSSILPGGANHDYYKQKLDKVASVLNNLRGADNKLIPVIFRPFHEFDGSWFWWGSQWCTPEQYKQIWTFTVQYLRDTKNVHNVLYAYSPDNSYTTSSQYLNRYPGDNYVDILGMDNYGDFNNQGAAGSSAANNKLKMVHDLSVSKIKILALTETGYQVTASNTPVAGWFSNFLYNAMTSNDIRPAYVMFWNNSQNGYYVPTPTAPNANDFIEFTNKPKALLENELPNMYVIE